MQEDCKDICKVLWEKYIWLRIVYLPSEKGFQKWQWNELFDMQKWGEFIASRPEPQELLQTEWARDIL